MLTKKFVIINLDFYIKLTFYNIQYNSLGLHLFKYKFKSIQNTYYSWYHWEKTVFRVLIFLPYNIIAHIYVAEILNKW